jgi:hypothetical protein
MSEKVIMMLVGKTVKNGIFNFAVNAANWSDGTTAADVAAKNFAQLTDVTLPFDMSHGMNNGALIDKNGTVGGV